MDVPLPHKKNKVPVIKKIKKIIVEPTTRSYAVSGILKEDVHRFEQLYYQDEHESFLGRMKNVYGHLKVKIVQETVVDDIYFEDLNFCPDGAEGMHSVSDMSSGSYGNASSTDEGFSDSGESNFYDSSDSTSGLYSLGSGFLANSLSPTSSSSRSSSGDYFSNSLSPSSINGGFSSDSVSYTLGPGGGGFVTNDGSNDGGLQTACFGSPEDYELNLPPIQEKDVGLGAKFYVRAAQQSYEDFANEFADEEPRIAEEEQLVIVAEKQWVAAEKQRFAEEERRVAADDQRIAEEIEEQRVAAEKQRIAED
jgi:hypothetical protein